MATVTTDPRKLIEEARSVVAHPLDDRPWRDIVDGLADALEAVLADLDTLVENNADLIIQCGNAEDERDALAAQIAAARAWDEWRNARMYGDEGTPYSNGAKAATTALIRILSADPAEILQEHDARVTEAAYDHGVSEGYAVALSDVESGKGNNVRAEKVRQAVRAEVIGLISEVKWRKPGGGEVHASWDVIQDSLREHFGIGADDDHS